jgi:hypothetical protein
MASWAPASYQIRLEHARSSLLVDGHIPRSLWFLCGLDLGEVLLNSLEFGEDVMVLGVCTLEF